MAEQQLQEQQPTSYTFQFDDIIIDNLTEDEHKKINSISKKTSMVSLTNVILKNAAIKSENDKLLAEELELKQKADELNKSYLLLKEELEKSDLKRKLLDTQLAHKQAEIDHSTSRKKLNTYLKDIAKRIITKVDDEKRKQREELALTRAQKRAEKISKSRKSKKNAETQVDDNELDDNASASEVEGDEETEELEEN